MKTTRFVYKTSLGTFAFLAALVCSSKGNIDSKNYIKVKDRLQAVTTADKVYTTAQHYCYRLEKPFAESPDSFETWINVPANSMGGVIMGNHVYSFGKNADGTYDTTVKWYIDSIGRFSFNWGVSGITHTFTGKFLNDGNWHHVALVRDPQTNLFTYYLDGEEESKFNAIVKDALVPNAMGIGCDYSNWTEAKTPFDGKIREITVYTDGISAERVKQDYQYGLDYGEGVKDDYNGKLLGNWYLGEEWKNLQISDSMGKGPNGYLASFEKYVPVAETPDFDYTILGIPDIQTMVDFPRNDWNKNNVYYQMMNWIGDHIDSEKMVFAIQTGDIADDGSTEIHFQRAKCGFDFWDGALPYGVVPGNHDYTDNCSSSRDLRLYNEYFGPDSCEEFGEFGGVMEEGHSENSYYLFEAAGVKYCEINLELFPRISAIRWAGRVCEEYPDRRVIINTHQNIDYYGRVADTYTGWTQMNYGWKDTVECNYSRVMYDELVYKYKNVFMTIGGHHCVDDIVMSKEYGVHGNPIIELLIDVQCSNNNLTSSNWQVEPIDVFLMMKFNESNKEIYFRYFSPKYNAAWNLQNQFTLSFEDWQDPIAGSYK